MGISIWQLLIILAIVLVLFGAKRLRTLGSDLGGAVKGFKDSMKEGEQSEESKDSKKLDQEPPIVDTQHNESHSPGRVIDGDVNRDRDRV